MCIEKQRMMFFNILDVVFEKKYCFDFVNLLEWFYIEYEYGNEFVGDKMLMDFFDLEWDNFVVVCKEVCWINEFKFDEDFM